MAEEPDELDHGGKPDATPSVSRDAIWKSVPDSTGKMFGCERATFYHETVRDARGYRLRFGGGEPMLFGIGVDVAVEHIVGLRASGGPVDASLIGVDLSDEGYGEPLLEEQVRDLLGSAVERGYGKARGTMRAEPWTDDDWGIFRDRLTLAMEKFLGLWPNRVSEAKGETRALPEPEGTPPGPPVAWLDAGPGMMMQTQRKMTAPDVAGGRGVSLKPDLVYARGPVIVGWLDVKAQSKSGSYPARWLQGDTVTYDYACTIESEGVLPEWHGYMEYRRVGKPYWALTVAPVSPSALDLARSYFRRWGIALDSGDPDALSFNPRSCAKCDWREPNPLHDGCPIGQAVLAIGPDVDATD